MSFNNFKTDSDHFKTLLKEQGIFEAIRFINSKSVHRFTALYSFDGPTLRNICLVDKENQSVREMETINVTDSYCFYVRNSGHKFLIPDSLVDERVQGHPKQDVIRSYCGMPIVGTSAMLGTLCHFDFSPLTYTEEEVLLLEQVTPILIEWFEGDLQRQISMTLK